MYAVVTNVLDKLRVPPFFDGVTLEGGGGKLTGEGRWKVPWKRRTTLKDRSWTHSRSITVLFRNIVWSGFE